MHLAPRPAPPRPGRPAARPDAAHGPLRPWRRAGAGLTLALLLTACSATPEPAPTVPSTPTPSVSPDAEPSRSPGAEPADSASPGATPVPGDDVPPPDEHSAIGDLPEGFPEQLLPLPEDAEVLVATYAPEDDAGSGQPYRVGLNLRTALPVADVTALYRTTLTAAGFTETVGTPTQGLAAEATYSRSSGDDLITVGVLDQDGVRTVTVGGRLRAAD